MCLAVNHRWTVTVSEDTPSMTTFRDDHTHAVIEMPTESALSLYKSLRRQQRFNAERARKLAEFNFVDPSIT